MTRPNLKQWLADKMIFLKSFRRGNETEKEEMGIKPQLDKETPHPFWVLVQKEVTDHMRSWRYVILLAILLLTCMGSLYTALMSIRDAVSGEGSDVGFVFLKLFTVSDGTLPPFITFVGFLGPLLGITLGFDAVNSELNKRTLIRILAQPVPRDYVINAKFVGALMMIGLLFFGLGFLVMGLGLMMIGIPPTPEEFLRMLAFLILSVVYVAFWLNLAILFSIRFRQAATSALASIAVWLFFSVFYQLIVNMIGLARGSTGLAPEASATAQQIQLVQALLRLSPNHLFSEATTTLLVPSIRSLGPLTMEQVYGALPTPLPLGQSLMLVWPQVTALIAVTMLCFAFSYVSFMRQDIRAR
ncbi:ABC-2 type transport system permease protein [Caldalkalibacillus uzonensis]|uniref:ABC-2 type transport system permease protein n=1 Tax=Caldalkalibacillus uzonensis TaxID=353224 RepID=A0ABU0CN26_9BACI|nr:ABC transporter permease [Caldalkalibacillus uzonensis]MDQ0337825.1 ABC-2 type transport system permease protein [Caldalkalibacillus uzonensis]